MARQQQPPAGAVTFPAFTDFSGKEFQNVSFRGAVFEGKVNFHNARFIGFTDFAGATFKGPSDFTDAVFDGDAVFHGATFGEPAKFNNAKFKACADFGEVRFRHDVHFSHTTFDDSASFGKAEFHAWGLFDSSRFVSTITFSESTFFGSANFKDVDFATHADFSATRFIAYMDFPRARFHGKAEFAKASIECKTVFREAVFDRAANFNDCRFTHPVSFASTEFHAPVTFNRVAFKQFVDFSNAHLFDSFVLSPADGSEGQAPELRFESVHIDHPEKVRFAGISFEKITLMGTTIRGICLEKPSWPKRGLMKKRAVVYDEIQKEKPDPDKLATLYRDIRANLGVAGTTADLGDLFYSEMEVRRKQRRAGKDSFYFFRRYLSPYTLFWLTCGYGRRPLRAATTAALAILLIYFR